MKIAIVRGPWSRPNSAFLLWEYIYDEYDDVDVVGIGSDPSWFDTSDHDIPVELVDWWDGKLDAFGYENVVYQLLEKYKFPNIALSGMRRIVEEYDAVHVTENYRLYSFYAALLCARSDTKLFVDCHENIPHRPANPVTWGTKRTVNRLADGFTSPTMDSKRALIHEGVDPDRVQLLPNVIDVDAFDAGPKDADAASLSDHLESTFNFLFVHGLNERKGVYHLLDAFDRVREQFDDVSLIVVGENSLDEAYYRERVAAAPAVHHVEYIPEIESLYQLSDAFVLPSIASTRWEEQFGRAILEAMACGLPTVVTNVGGPPLVVEEGQTSLVVEPRSTDELAAAMTELYENDELARRLGENAYEYVREHYAPNVVGDVLYEFYRSHLAD